MADQTAAPSPASEQPAVSRVPGRLKIFLGYAAGVGKTYAMLAAARHAQESGVDVAAGYIEPHTRPETLALLEGIERLPTRQVSCKGILLHEFDLDGALTRAPQLLLVDELAHSNAPGSRHVKRYQDIEELLRAGIDVYTTANVQHLESLHDMVAAITGISVKERVPDRVFDAADQVELVDLEPAELLERLAEGKVYRAPQSLQTADRFFTQKNLAALREIALRRTADRLNRAQAAPGARAVTDEHILTCLSSAPSNAKVIRTAARMAEAFHSNFTALFVEPSNFSGQSPEDRQRLRANLRLAEELGARIATVYGDDAAVQIAEYARVSGVSKIVMGRSNQKRGPLGQRKSLMDRLADLAPGLDIYIIPDSAHTSPQPYRRKSFRTPKERGGFRPGSIARVCLPVAAATLVGWGFYAADLTEANIITVYILGVMIVTLWTDGRLYGVLASLLSVLCFNFFFTVPRFTFKAIGRGYPVTFLVMLVASFIVSSLTRRVKEQALQSAQKAYRTQVLLETSQKLQKAEGENAILDAAAVQLRKLLGRTVLMYPAKDDAVLGEPRIFPGAEQGAGEAFCTSAEERAAAEWVHKNNKHAGATTNTLPGVQCLYLAVRGERGVLAVAGVVIAGQPEPDAFEKNLLLAILDECGLVLEKERLDKAKREMEETARQEALRANLLRGISHDLRTPLTSISGNAGILMENSGVLTEGKKRELYVSIYDDSLWLSNLVENLLSVTRIENGTMKLHMEPELLEEVFSEALNHLDRRAAEHHISVDVPDDLLMARMDARLIVQVVINIVNNAIKYTPSGSHITLSARRRGGAVLVEIADDGPGVADANKEKLFEMFYTADNARGDGRRGLGLGLALCRSIVTAHGGFIAVRDNEPRGSIFYFTLQNAEVNANE